MNAEIPWTTFEEPKFYFNVALSNHEISMIFAQDEKESLWTWVSKSEFLEMVEELNEFAKLVKRDG